MRPVTTALAATAPVRLPPQAEGPALAEGPARCRAHIGSLSVTAEEATGPVRPPAAAPVAGPGPAVRTRATRRPAPRAAGRARGSPPAATVGPACTASTRSTSVPSCAHARATRPAVGLLRRRRPAARSATVAASSASRSRVSASEVAAAGPTIRANPRVAAAHGRHQLPPPVVAGPGVAEPVAAERARAGQQGVHAVVDVAGGGGERADLRPGPQVVGRVAEQLRQRGEERVGLLSATTPRVRVGSTNSAATAPATAPITVSTQPDLEERDAEPAEQPVEHADHRRHEEGHQPVGDRQQVEGEEDAQQHDDPLQHGVPGHQARHHHAGDQPAQRARDPRPRPAPPARRGSPRPRTPRTP